MANINPLRPITQRLIHTPVEDLPRIASFLATSIANCASLLQQAESAGSENATLVHKLQTRISSLLFDKTVRGRLSASILIRSTIEAGGSPLLAKSGPWARELVHCLSKPDPDEVKELYLATVLRIFTLCKGSPTLEREICTPLLTPFLKDSIVLVKPLAMAKGDHKSTLTSTLSTAVFQCWVELLQLYPQTFRPFLVRIKPIILSVLGDFNSSQAAVQLASQVLASLPLCAAKNDSVSEFSKLASNIIGSTHATADQALPAIRYQPPSGQHSTAGPPDFAQSAESQEIDSTNRAADVLGFSSWKGIAGGVQRTAVLVGLLRHLCQTRTSQAVPVPLGRILNLTSRLLVVPSSSATFVGDASREEREELYVHLPQLRVSCIQLHHALVKTYGQAMLPLCEALYDQSLIVVRARSPSTEERLHVFRLCEYMLQHLGPSGLLKDPRNFSVLTNKCCDDVRNAMALASTTAIESRTNGQAKAATIPDFGAPGSEKQEPKGSEQDHELTKAATKLLCSILQFVPASAIPHALRTLLDSTAILSNNKDAMLASVLNPPSSKQNQLSLPSILPFLARQAPAELGVEALLRPRTAVSVTPATDALDEVNITNGRQSSSPMSHDEQEDSDLLSKLTDSVEDKLNNAEVERVGSVSQDREADSEATKKRDFAAMNQQEPAGPPHFDKAIDFHKWAIETAQKDKPVDLDSSKRLKQAGTHLEPGATGNTRPTTTEPTTVADIGADASAPMFPLPAGIHESVKAKEVDREAPATISSDHPGTMSADAEDEDDDDEIPTLDPTQTDSEDEVEED